MIMLVLLCDKCWADLEGKGELCARVWQKCCHYTGCSADGYVVAGKSGTYKSILKYLELGGYVISTETAAEERYKALGWRSLGNVQTFCAKREIHCPSKDFFDNVGN